MLDQPKYPEQPGMQAQVNLRSKQKRQPASIVAGLITVSLIPLLAIMFVAWSQVHGATSQIQRTALVAQQPLRVHQSPKQAPAAPDTAQIAAQVDSLVQGQVAKKQFTGSVLVAVGDQIVLAKGYGLANDTSGIANTPDTRFFLGSVTKEFTATSILLLQQAGKLHVQDLLCKYVPNCPAPWQAITIREVLMHTSGIPQPDDSQLSDVSPDAWIGSFDNLSLEFAPGTQYDYCSTCYQILAYVVQQVSGEPYTQYVQNKILTPLKMTRSGFDPTVFYSQPGHALGYASWQAPADDLGWTLGPQWAFFDGSGLLYSTLNDLYRWDQALYTNVLLPQSVLATAFTPYVSAAELFPGSEYGYGWFITKSPVAGHRLIWHDGVIDGFRNYIGRYVDDHVTIIALSNLATIDPVAEEQSIQQVVFAHLT